MTMDMCAVASMGEERTPSEYRLEYHAFRQMHQQPYLRYARLRTGDADRAARTVSRTFAALCARWPDTLSSACPAAAAWEILSTAVGGEGQCGTGPERRDSCLLTAAQADAVRLTHHLGFSVEETAALTGMDNRAVRGLLRTAGRIACDRRSCSLIRP
ncbi:hypothetical protein ACFRK5_33575 [Streptomyces niveus]|uniref:hypothetical protein n=1 Tax=Streptomyces niveus TaxID=193462 RepID=UPI0036A1286F